MRVGILFLLVMFLAPASAGAFHDGGVASCKGCHVMHQSEDGMMVPAQGYLIADSSPTDLCLGCHGSSNGAVFGLDPLFPDTEYGGGNFIFLLEDDLNDAVMGMTQPIAGEAAGHSVVGSGAGLFPDSRHTLGPGGTFPTSLLGCTSCHDPHGNGNFRMLHGPGVIQGGLYSFMAPAPLAEGVALNGPGEGPANHTAYLDGWAAWCGNCHGFNYHETIQGGFEHPVDIPLGLDVAAWYNAYDGDANPAGGDPASAYLPEVPFEDPAATVSGTAGPSAASRVTCITCHRAHGTSAPAGARWDGNVPTAALDGAASGSWPIPSPYLDPAQRSLCVQCHDVSHDNGKACLQCHAPGKGGGGGGPLPTGG